MMIVVMIVVMIVMEFAVCVTMFATGTAAAWQTMRVRMPPCRQSQHQRPGG
jgi:hypothetical protein